MSDTEHESNGYQRMAREAAEALIRRNIMPLPLAYGSKHAGSILGDGWQNKLLGEDYSLDVFNKPKLNIGMRLGHITNKKTGQVLTDRFADVDLDIMEAVRAAPFYLPETGMIWGRASKPRSHYGYRIRSLSGTKSHRDFADPLQTKSKQNPDGRKAQIAELRFSSGEHTLAPGSTNKQDGYAEDVRYEEDGDGDPSEVDYGDLARLLANVSAAALVGRYWSEGMRHAATGPLAGMLYRGGMALEDAETFIRAVCAAAQERDADTENRVGYVRDTYAKLARGEKAITGAPTLETYLDTKLITKVREWLGLRSARKQEKSDTPEKPRKLVLQSMADVEAQRIEWLFDGYIPLGELSALAGAGGAGKTSAAIDLAVRTAGHFGMPHAARCDVPDGEAAGVLYMTSENHPSKVLRPRMEAAALRLSDNDPVRTHATLQHIYIHRGVVTLPDGVPIGSDGRLAEVVDDPKALVLPRDIAVLRAAIIEQHIRLVIIDPVISFTEKDVDVLNPAEMRQLLDPLALVAQELNIAVFALVHFSKAVGVAVILRVSLSRQMTDTARAVGVVLEDPRDDCADLRWLALAKNNLGATPPAYSYKLVPVAHPTFSDETTAVIEWGETRTAKADKLEQELAAEAALSRQTANDPFGAGSVNGARSQDAVKYLGERIQEIRDNGDLVVTSNELDTWFEEGGFSKETWTKARKHLGVKTAPDGKQGFWSQDLDELEWLKKIPTKQDMQQFGLGYNDPTTFGPPTPHVPGTPGGRKVP